MKKVLLSIVLSSLVLANEFNTGIENEISWLKEETYVVSASRVKENIDKSAASITVVDEDTISKMGADNILDVLRIIPGLGVTQSNIFANEVEARGIKDWFSKQILFMIDGHAVDVNLLNGGATWILDKIHVKNIKRVEVVKGPASALYGANAFTALVNIITKKAKDIGGTEVSVKIGSYETKEANILFGDEYDGLSIVGNLNFYKTDGNSVFVNEDNVQNNGYTNPHRKQFVANIGLEYHDFYLSSMFSERTDGQYYGPIGALTNVTKPNGEYFFIESGYRKDFTASSNINIKAYYDRYKADNRWGIYPKGSPTPLHIYGFTIINGYTNDKYGSEAIYTYKHNDSYTLLVGAVFEKQNQYDVVNKENFDALGNPLPSLVDMSDSENTFAPKVDRTMHAFYMNNLYDVSSSVRLTFGMRYDSYSDVGSNLAPRGGLSWEINEKNRIKILYGEGFRVATFAELYNINSPVINGNPNLDPENVETYELSFESNVIDKLDTKFTYFHNSFSNLIVQEANSYINRGKTATQGIELQAKYNLNRGSYIQANYTYQNAKDKLVDKDLPDIANNKANVILNYRINKYINSYNHLFLKGKTKRATTDSRDNVDAYAVLDTSLVVDNFYEGMKLRVSIKNLLDKRYFHPSRYGLLEDDYEQTGRNFMFDMSYKF